ncbi:flavin reductase family protein [Acuticoccus sp. I52.16.1]|uniref:flavin reductase family protein n=1 Tax=Acuticoccus sp. I52.16.1 TaxID=2928472 RepID=UPI001FD627A7|nr:flavin reductase family protein [Acuticoccus sp. I52.16.1]UOM36574.1 flavin reductase family protein [Acuticoccus sp. I52.16.1]
MADETSPPQRDAFLAAMRRAASLVSVVSTGAPHARRALTVGSFASVSADPPLVSVCIRATSPMCAALEDHTHFTVHVLGEDHAHVADTFAGRPPEGTPYDFDCASWIDRGDGREPSLEDAAIVVDCLRLDAIALGSHRLFVGEVTDVETSGAMPLLYFDRDYCVPLVRTAGR